MKDDDNADSSDSTVVPPTVDTSTIKLSTIGGNGQNPLERPCKIHLACINQHLSLPQCLFLIRELADRGVQM